MSKRVDEPVVPNAKLLTETVGGVVRELWMVASYDLRSHPRNFGGHCAKLEWVVKAGDCAVSWVHDAGWLQGSLQESWPAEHCTGDGAIFDHSPVPCYPDEGPNASCCSHTGVACYGSGDYQLGSDLFAAAVADPAVIWPRLEARLAEVVKWAKEQREMERKYS